MLTSLIFALALAASPDPVVQNAAQHEQAHAGKVDGKDAAGQPAAQKDIAKKAGNTKAQARNELTERQKRIQDRRDRQRRNQRRNRWNDNDAGMGANTRRLCPSC